MNKIIICCPHFKILGGVSNYYQVFSIKQSINAKLFFIGKRSHKITKLSRIQTAYQYITDYIRFFLIIQRYDQLVVNPSMSKLCLHRDALYIRIAKLFRKKVVVFWRGFNHLYFNEVVKHRYQSLLKSTFFRADHTIVLGENIYESLHSIGCNTPYSIHTTIIPSELILRSPKSFTHGKFTILFLARLEKDKGILEAIECYRLVKRIYPFVNMLIAGDGKDFLNIQKFIIEENISDVELLGNVSGESKYNAYYHADLYLFPSYYEGMPNSVLEAMGMGLPVITSKVGGLPDFFENGKMGYMIDDWDSKKYADAVLRLIEHDNLGEISDYNRNYAKEIFLDDIVISKLEKCLLEVCNQ